MSTRDRAARWAYWCVVAGVAIAGARCGPAQGPVSKVADAAAPQTATGPAATKKATAESMPAQPQKPADPPKPRTADEIATITDSTGVSSNLTTFEVKLEEGKGDLMRQGWLGYESMYSVPVREKNGLFLAIPIDRIASVENTAAGATISLASGESVSGALLSECSFAGETSLGNVAIAAAKTRRVEFDAAKVRRFLLKKQATPRDSDFLAGADGVPGTVTLRSGETLTLTKLSLVFQYSGCSANWMPCKPFTSWSQTKRLTIARGSFATEVQLSKTDAIELRPGDPPGVTAILRGGQSVEGSLKLGEGVFQSNDSDLMDGGDTIDRLVGIVGTAALGNVHVPADIIKSMAFKPARAAAQKGGR